MCEVRLLPLMFGLRRFTMAEFILKTDHPKGKSFLLRLARRTIVDDSSGQTIRIFVSVKTHARTDSQMNYCSLPKFIPDG